MFSYMKEIGRVARKLQSLQERAWTVYRTSEDSTTRSRAISAIAHVGDAQQTLRAVFESLDVRDFPFEELLNKSDKELYEANFLREAKSFCKMHEGELGGAENLSEVVGGLYFAIGSRLQQIEETMYWATT